MYNKFDNMFNSTNLHICFSVDLSLKEKVKKTKNILDAFAI